MEQVRYDLQRIQFRYGTSAEENKASPEVLSETTKYMTKEDEEDTESRQLSELVAPPNKVAEIEKPHEGEIVVTSYRLNPKSANEPVHQVPTTVTV